MSKSKTNTKTKKIKKNAYLPVWMDKWLKNEGMKRYGSESECLKIGLYLLVRYTSNNQLTKEQFDSLVNVKNEFLTGVESE